MSELLHLPDRPSWDCQACRKPWPCDPAREDLLGSFTPTGLAFYVCAHLVDAAGDMPARSPAELYERFIAWTRAR